jgi:hypothetical protein
VWRKLHAWLAGEDGPGRGALPLGEFLHPVPLAALVVLALNDHRWKGAGWLPMWLTGKLSDFAGLLFFPLLLTALYDTLACMLARATGWKIDFSLRRWKVVVALLVTAAVFVPLELSAAWGTFYVETLGRIGFPSQTTMDLTDLWAVVMLPVAGWLGWAEIRRVPLGRLEVIARARPDDVAAELRDVRRGDELAAAYTAWLAAPSDERAAAVNAILREVRGLSGRAVPAAGPAAS